MFRYVLAVTFSLVVVDVASAQRFYIPPGNRVSVPGACLYNCGSTLAIVHGYPQARGLSGRMMVSHRITIPGTSPPQYGAEGRQEFLRTEFNRIGVRYVYQPTGTFDWRGLQQHAGQGVLVQVHHGGQLNKPGHALLVIQYRSNASGNLERDRVSFWNSSSPSHAGSVSRMTFARDWYGNTLRVLPRETRLSLPINK